MIEPQRLPASLTPLEIALTMLRGRIAPVVPREMALADAQGCIAAPMPALSALPTRARAAIDGWAFSANDLVGASSYAPLPLATAPIWIEAGEAMPAHCDCVVAVDLVEQSGPLCQVVGDAIPGQGVRRIGGDIAEGSVVASAGQPIRAIDLMLARRAGLATLAVRRPRLGLIDHAASDSRGVTLQMISELAQAEGAEVMPCGFDTIDPGACDLVVSIGGTGVGRADRAVHLLSQHGTLLAYGLALQPGRTTAIGVLDGAPVIALPGAPDQALAAWWALAVPVLDQLSARAPRPRTSLPLARKIASGVGIAELVLLQAIDAAWMPLATGDFSLDQIARADAWCLVPSGSEGFAAGSPLAACMI